MGALLWVRHHVSEPTHQKGTLVSLPGEDTVEEAEHLAHTEKQKENSGCVNNFFLGDLLLWARLQ